MSGGSHNYIYSSIALALDIPSGTYGIGEGKYGNYEEDVRSAREANPMMDKDLSELMYDVSCLLHSLEWCVSGDIRDEQYMKDVATFKKKWFGRNGSEEQKEAYKKDITDMLHKMLDEIERGE